MALIQTGGGVAVISGKVGGWVFGRNAGGAYIRNWVVPIDPGSARQQVVRFAMAQLATRWGEILTDAQRASWKTYADNVPLPNRLGALRPISALAMYTRCNVPRLTSGEVTLTIIDDAPSIFDVGTYTAPVASAVDDTLNTVSWAFTDTDDWATIVGGAMYIYASAPKNPSVNFFKGPYGLIGTVLGAVIPPTSPVVLPLNVPVELGQRVFFRANVSHADGRLASEFRTFQDVT